MSGMAETVCVCAGTVAGTACSCEFPIIGDGTFGAPLGVTVTGVFADDGSDGHCVSTASPCAVCVVGTYVPVSGIGGRDGDRIGIGTLGPCGGATLAPTRTCGKPVGCMITGFTGVGCGFGITYSGALCEVTGSVIVRGLTLGTCALASCVTDPDGYAAACALSLACKTDVGLVIDMGPIDSTPGGGNDGNVESVAPIGSCGIGSVPPTTDCDELTIVDYGFAGGLVSMGAGK